VLGHQKASIGDLDTPLDPANPVGFDRNVGDYRRD